MHGGAEKRNPVGLHSKQRDVDSEKCPSFSTVTRCCVPPIQQPVSCCNANHSSCVTSSTTTWFSQSSNLLLQPDSLRTLLVRRWLVAEDVGCCCCSSSCSIAIRWAASSVWERPAAISAFRVLSKLLPGWAKPTGGERGTPAVADNASSCLTLTKSCVVLPLKKASRWG